MSLDDDFFDTLAARVTLARSPPAAPPTPFEEDEEEEEDADDGGGLQYGLSAAFPISETSPRESWAGSRARTKRHWLMSADDDDAPAASSDIFSSPSSSSWKVT